MSKSAKTLIIIAAIVVVGIIAFKVVEIVGILKWFGAYGDMVESFGGMLG